MKFSIKPNRIPYKIPMPNNMGVVRYILAVIVFFAHFKELAGYEFYFPISSYTAVGGFFVLSGYLIYGSFLRKPNLKSYIASRARRILPAYMMTVVFFAIVFSIISSDGISQYFRSTQLYKYLVANVFFANFLEPSLPGVFNGMKITAVNGSLWTMKVEWFLYLSVPVVFWFIRRFRFKPTIIFALIYIISACYRVVLYNVFEETGEEIYRILSRQFLGQLTFFYVGVLIYFYFNAFLKYKNHLLIMALLSLLFQNYIPYFDFIIFPITIGILVIWLSMVGTWGTWEGKRDNVSYNIYLIHFPVIQCFVWLSAGKSPNVIFALTCCLTVTVILSLLLNRFEKLFRY